MIEDINFKGEDIAGEWIGFASTPSGESQQTVQVTRRGYRVFGTIRAIKGTHVGMTYVFEGTYRSLLLTATYDSGDPRRLDRGTFTLMLTEGGSQLVGGEAAHITADNTVGYFKYQWRRPESQ
jgi:hypothetical protein